MHCRCCQHLQRRLSHGLRRMAAARGRQCREGCLLLSLAASCCSTCLLLLLVLVRVWLLLLCLKSLGLPLLVLRPAPDFELCWHAQGAAREGLRCLKRLQTETPRASWHQQALVMQPDCWAVPRLVLLSSLLAPTASVHPCRHLCHRSAAAAGGWRCAGCCCLALMPAQQLLHWLCWGFSSAGGTSTEENTT